MPPCGRQAALRPPQPRRAAAAALPRLANGPGGGGGAGRRGGAAPGGRAGRAADAAQASPVDPGFRQAVVQVYRAHNPGRLGEVDAVLERWRGREVQLLQRLHRKYGKTQGRPTG